MRIESGTTLVELLVVLSILATVAATGVVAFGTLAERRLERETAATCEWLKTVKREALLRGTAFEIRHTEAGLETRPRSVSLKPKQNGGLKIAVLPGNPVWQSLCFFPDGSACPGYLELAGFAGKRRLRVDWFGGLRVERID